MTATRPALAVVFVVAVAIFDAAGIDALPAAYNLFGDASTMLRDADGRQRVFHGFNTVVKLPPFVPTTDRFDAMSSLSAEDLQLMQSLGYTSLRMNVPWAAVEPTRGVYNESYLDALEAVVDLAGSESLCDCVAPVKRDGKPSTACLASSGGRAS